jgi:hypothetical protein
MKLIESADRKKLQKTLLGYLRGDTPLILVYGAPTRDAVLEALATLSTEELKSYNSKIVFLPHPMACFMGLRGLTWSRCVQMDALLEDLDPDFSMYRRYYFVGLRKGLLSCARALFPQCQDKDSKEYLVRIN